MNAHRHGLYGSRHEAILKWNVTTWGRVAQGKHGRKAERDDSLSLLVAQSSNFLP